MTKNKVPVIYEISDGEANGTVHFFCCGECRTQKPFVIDGEYELGTCSPYEVSPGIECETCSVALDDIFPL